MRFGSRVTVTDVLSTFAEAEVSSPRYGRFYEKLLEPATLARLRAVPAVGWTDSDRAAAIRVLRSYRGGFIEPLLALGGKWLDGAVAVGELGDLRTTESPGFRILSADLRLLSLVVSIEVGGKDEGNLGPAIRSLAAMPDSFAARGRPLLAGTSRRGPFVVAEGTTRLSAALLRSRAGAPVPEELPVYVGIQPRLREWGFAPAIQD